MHCGQFDKGYECSGEVKQTVTFQSIRFAENAEKGLLLNFSDAICTRDLVERYVATPCCYCFRLLEVPEFLRVDQIRHLTLI